MAESYFEKNDIQGLMDQLVKQLAVEQPTYPAEWLATQLNPLAQPCETSVTENGHPKWFNPAAMKGA